MSKNSFLKGAVVLGVAGLIVKILGAFFRIPLGRLITSEGMGYYQTAYPIYVLLLSISTSGFPIAISKMVSERRAVGNYKGAHRVFTITLKILLVLGLLTFSIFFFGARIIVNALNNPNAYYSMVALAPALLFVPIMAAYRGYFQGRNNMTPTAVSQIIEQSGRVGFGLILAYFLMPKGLDYAAAGGSFGATAGAIFGMAFILFVYYINKPKIEKELLKSEDFEEESYKVIIKSMLTIALPIIIGASVMPIMNMIDVSIVINRLMASGYSQSEANALYGQLTGMAATLINLPQVLTMSIAMSIVPVVSQAYALRDMESVKENANLSVRMAVLLGLPSGVGLMVLATPTMQLLYPNEPASIGQILFFMSLGVVFLSLIQTLTGILQGLGKSQIPVMNLFIAAIFKLVCTYTLTSIPSLNVKGAAIGTVLAYMIAAGLDIYWVRKLLNIKFDINHLLIKPLLTAAIMGVVAKLTHMGLTDKLGNSLSTVIAIVLAIIVYVVVLILIGGITKEEIEKLPKGKKLSKFIPSKK